MDIKLVRGDDFLYDISFSNNDLLKDEGMETAVLISLHTDRRLDEEQHFAPLGQRDLRGWWGDEYLETEGDKVGSHLWTIKKVSWTSARLAEQFTRRCLQWFVEDGIASKIDVFAEPDSRNGRINIKIDMFRADELVSTFNYVWEGQLGFQQTNLTATN